MSFKRSLLAKRYQHFSHNLLVWCLVKKKIFLHDIFWCWQVILGVDRLDMIKGILQKYLAFEKFLEENPYWRDKVVLVQIAVPTRNDVPECKKTLYTLMLLILYRIYHQFYEIVFAYRSKAQKPSPWTRWSHKRSFWFCLFSSNPSSGLFDFSIYITHVVIS